MPAKKKAKKKAAPVGRPSSYDSERYPIIAKAMSRLGATHQEVAAALQVALSNFNKWRKAYPEFEVALKEGKALSDSHVEDGLYRRALGYEYTEVKVVEDEKAGKRTETTTKQRAPDVAAQIFWLKNRKPDQWRDVREVTGPGGEAIEIALVDLERKLISKPSA